MGIEEAWKEIHYGADIAIPKVYKFIMKYVTPIFLVAIFVTWVVQKGPSVIRMDEVPLSDRPYILFVRVLLFILAVIIGIGIKVSWNQRRQKK